MKKQNLIQIFYLKKRRIKLLLKSATRIRKSAIRLNSKNPKSVENPGFFKTDFCKNPNPHPIQKFDELPPLVKNLTKISAGHDGGG